MTGPEHYRQAEQLAARAAGWPDFDRWEMGTEERIGRQQADAALAQVHATLALAAATALAVPVEGAEDQVRAWHKAGAW